jgi:hypothetical protein
VSRAGVNILFNPDFLGEPRFEEAFALTPACQDAILRICDDLRLYNASEEYLRLIKRDARSQGSIKCFLKDLRDEIARNGWSRAEQPGRLHVDDVAARIPTFLAMQHNESGEIYKEKYANLIGWDGSALQFVGIAVESANLQAATTAPEHVTARDYAGYEALRENMDFIAREACGSEVMMTDLQGKFVYMNNQRIFRTSALKGALLGVVIAFVVIFISTRSLIISLASTSCILATFLSVIGLVTMMGWELGAVEAILISILAGFSVDYTVHLAHVYATDTSGARGERVTATFAVRMLAPMLPFG